MVDNTTLFWLLRSQRAPRSAMMTRELRRLYDWCFRNGTTLVASWVNTLKMAECGADAASRSAKPYQRRFDVKDVLDCFEAAAEDTARLMTGCNMPVKAGAWHLPPALVKTLFQRRP